MSSAQAIALVDTNTADFGQWFSPMRLFGKAVPGDLIEVQWWEMFSVTNGEMSVSIHFFNGGKFLNYIDYVIRGQSSGWNGSPGSSFFTKRKETFTEIG